MTLVLIGGFTAMLGAAMSINQLDLKKMLAYITISALGLLVCAIGLQDALAIQAAFLYLLAHAIYKGALFMTAGNVDKVHKTRDIRYLGNISHSMPFTGAAILLASLAMAGMPPFIAFVAKEKLYELALEQSGWASFSLVAFFFSSVVYAGVAIRLGYRLLFAPSLKEETPEKAGEAEEPVAAEKKQDVPPAMWIPPLILGIIGLTVGWFPSLVQPFFNEVTDRIASSHKELDLSLWHGWTPALMLSLATYLSGWLIYRFRDHIFQVLHGVFKLDWLGPENMYDKGLDVLNAFSAALTRTIQNGQLTKYLKAIFMLVILLLSFTYIKYDLFPSDWNFQQEIKFRRIYEFLPIVMIISGVIMLLNESSRLTMLVALSLIGYGIALFYAMFSAPDVSMTQFLVETITLVVFTIILHRMPKNAVFPRSKRQFLVVAIAFVFGVLMTVVLSSLQDYTVASEMKEFYISNSASRGKGENVVNVMLVDFRAFDTFGEMAVLCMTALGVMALIRLKTYRNNNL